jgi:hypothetical protein
MRKHKTTARPGEAERFEREKILVMDIAKSLMASYDDGNFYIKDALILQDPQKEFAYKYILSLLNSKLLNFYYTKSFDVLSVALNAIKQLPIKEISLSAQQPFVDKADLMLSLNQQHHDRSDTVLRFLTQKYTIIKPSTKLQKRRELDFA